MFLSITQHLLFRIAAPLCSIWSRLAPSILCPNGSAEANWPMGMSHFFGHDDWSRGGSKTQAHQSESFPGIQMKMLAKKVAVRMPLSWATTACGGRLVENEAQETEGSRAESLKETDRDGGQS